MSTSSQLDQPTRVLDFSPVCLFCVVFKIQRHTRSLPCSMPNFPADFPCSTKFTFSLPGFSARLPDTGFINSMDVDELNYLPRRISAGYFLLRFSSFSPNFKKIPTEMLSLITTQAACIMPEFVWNGVTGLRLKEVECLVGPWFWFWFCWIIFILPICFLSFLQFGVPVQVLKTFQSLRMYQDCW